MPSISIENTVRTSRLRITTLLACCLVVSCVATQVTVASTESATIPGFFAGFWHGLIAPIAFVVSLFTDHVRVYAFPNGGRWYDLGFMLGIGGFTHGAGTGHRLYRTSARRERITVG
jgi:hypothetical protein